MLASKLWPERAPRAAGGDTDLSPARGHRAAIAAQAQRAGEEGRWLAVSPRPDSSPRTHDTRHRR